MRKISIFILMLIAAAIVGAGAMPVLAVGGDAAAGIRSDAARLGQVGFGEAAGEGSYLPVRIGFYIRGAIGILGVVLVVIFVYAGYLWMTAGGDQTQVGKAKSWMLNAVIGLAILLSAYAITNFVISQLVKSADNSSSLDRQLQEMVDEN